MDIDFVVIAAAAALVTLLVAVWTRAIRRSRGMVERYRNATPEERKQLEARMEMDGELETYMRPLAHWEIAVAATIVVGMFYALIA